MVDKELHLVCINYSSGWSPMVGSSKRNVYKRGRDVVHRAYASAIRFIWEKRVSTQPVMLANTAILEGLRRVQMDLFQWGFYIGVYRARDAP